ncbi:sigma-E factor regulatory protein RseB domain-containing protein, partial [Escherichia coli]
FKRHIRHREADIIAGLLDGLEEAKSQLNEQREYYEGVISDGSKRIAELDAREVQLPTRYDLRYGHPINADERHVMIPKENGSWLYLIDLEHALRVAGIRIKGEEHGNK